METYTSSCEMFHIRTKTWTQCNDLPYPLAFATVISTPKGAWILGGKTSPFERASVQMNLNTGIPRFTLLIWGPKRKTEEAKTA